MAIDKFLPLGCLLFCCFTVNSVLGALDQEIEAFSVVGALDQEIERLSVVGALDKGVERFSAGGRHLRQVEVPCPHQFGYDNYTIIKVSCPPAVNISQSADYPKKQCCAALASMLCPYLPLISDPNSQCVSEYFFLSTIGNKLYTEFFQFICTDPNSPQGIPCPSYSNSPPPLPNYGSRYGGSRFFPLIVLLSIAIVEVLFL